jgi:hypothetical protein
MALRDQNWVTFEHTIENERIDNHGNHFEIQYDCYHELRGTKIFSWHVVITGTADGDITFEVHGKAIADVLKNRAGICVLHPIHHTAGYPCELLSTDGSHIKKTFPVSISCENPFRNLQAFRWRCHHDWYVLKFEGDIFETEDQRNWCDASYKTFCTPLDKPFPVLLKAGDTVHQKITFRPESALLPIPEDTDHAIEITALDRTSALVSIGVAASTEIAELSDEMIQVLQALQLKHYRIEVHPSTGDWMTKFSNDCRQASALKLPLEIALHIADIKELEGFYKASEELQPVIKQIILLAADAPTTSGSLIRVFSSLKKHFPAVQIGGGTDYNYRELNCNPFDGSQLDFISFSIDPQEHASDDLTIIENIGAQYDTIHSARNLYGSHKPVHVSSLTLKKRFNPAATVSADRILSNEQKADHRQSTAFAAAFTLGSIKTLTQANANSVTLYQTAGNQGLVSSTGERFPVYEVMRKVLTAGTTQVVHTNSSKPLYCDALLFKKAHGFSLVLSNYTPSPQRVIFRKEEYNLKPYETRIENIP